LDASFKDLREEEINVIEEMRASAGEISKKLAANKIGRPATSQNVGGPRQQKNGKQIVI